MNFVLKSKTNKEKSTTKLPPLLLTPPCKCARAQTNSTKDHLRKKNRLLLVFLLISLCYSVTQSRVLENFSLCSSEWKNRAMGKTSFIANLQSFENVD